tara:strand:+ start:34 stop:543 length:510 start_codon:yes stop_codon:yes gene_type:complete
MPDYQKGKIYKLYSVSNEDLVYYGSTILTLNKRLSLHISDYKNDAIRTCNSKLVIAAGDYKIELIENYPCNSKVELNRREGKYTKANKCVNIRIAGRTKKEYREDNKEKVAERKKKYYENNKEKVAERKKKWYNLFGKEKITCECGCVVIKNSLAIHKKSNKHLELIKD